MAILSVLIPAYNEAAGLALAVEAVGKHLAPLGHEVRFLLIDDGSADQTWQVIEDLARKHPNVSGLGFSRNFGKEAALLAGLDACDGDCVILLDADLQHPPGVLPQMVQAWQDGFQIVHGIKVQRQGESWFRRACSSLVFGAARMLSGLDMQRSSDFKLLDHEVVLRYREFQERLLFFRGLIDWLGFRTTSIPFNVAERAAGKSQWGMWGLVKYALNAILSFSSRPLKIVSMLAVVFFILSSLIGLKTLYDWAVYRSAEGFPTVILLIVGFGNFTLVAICVVSWYIGKIYEEVKMRPRYIVTRTANRPRPQT
jgi:glycosyltransferase involved in cell wall biosynthesis